MPHDYILEITISTDTVFQFLTTDGNGKTTHQHYQTDDMDTVYAEQSRLSDLWNTFQYMTRDEVRAEKARIRKAVKATKF